MKQLVEMHGGWIEAHSPGLGHGSEFVIRLLPKVSGKAGKLALNPALPE